MPAPLSTPIRARGPGRARALTHTFYGAISLFIGIFSRCSSSTIRDGCKFSGWIARSTGLDHDTVNDVVRISRDSVRGYFRGTAITAILTAPIFIILLLILRIPLVLPIFVLLLLPLVPAVRRGLDRGIFAVLIAFGAGGLPAALHHQDHDPHLQRHHPECGQLLGVG